MKKSFVIAMLLSCGIAMVQSSYANQYEDKCIKPNNFPHEISNIGCLRYGLIPVSKGEAMGYANAQGQLVVPYQYSTTHNLYDDRGLVTKPTKDKKSYLAGYIDSQGKVVIPLIYDIELSNNFIEGMGVAWVAKNKKVGLIDKNGKVIIPFQYQYAYDFMENGLAWVKKNKKWGLIDKAGKIILPFEYDDYLNEHMPKNRHLVAKKGKYGYVDDFGKAITPLQYDTPFYSEYDTQQYWFDNGIARMTIKGKPSCVNIQGKTIKCPKY